MFATHALALETPNQPAVCAPELLLGVGIPAVVSAIAGGDVPAHFGFCAWDIFRWVPSEGAYLLAGVAMSLVLPAVAA